MINYKIRLLILLIIFFYSCTIEDQRNSLKCINGSINLTNWDFQKNGIIQLKGEWEFYWKKLFTPEDFLQKKVNQQSALFIKVPCRWKNFDLPLAQDPGEGYGTYRLRILLNDTEINSIKALKLNYISCAYNVWVNNQLLATVGKVGVSKKNMIPIDKHYICVFFCPSREIEIIIQVSDFYRKDGGIYNNILFGNEDKIYNNRTKRLYIDLFIIGSILIIAFYYIGFFFFLHNRRLIFLSFGIFCLVIALRPFFTNEIFINEIFPNINWYLKTRLELCDIFLLLPIAFLYFYFLFPKEIPKIILYIILVISSIFIGMSLFFPISTFGDQLSIYFIFIISVGVYILYINLIALIKNREGVIYSFIGILVLLLCAILDIFNNYTSYLNFYISHVGNLFFIIIQAFNLANIIRKIYTKNHFLSQKLRHYSQNLALKVRERTRDLEEATQMRTHFFINLAHETKTPLTLISNYLDRFIQKNGLHEELMILKQNIDRIKKDVINYMDAEKLQRGKLLYHHDQIINFSEMLEQKLILFKEYASKKEIELTSSIEKVLFIQADPYAIDRIINNLIDNAIKYTLPNGKINVQLFDTSTHIEFQVKDTGIGISEYQKEKIFSPFYQISNPKQNIQGIGMGLYIVSQLVQSLQAKLLFESKINAGSLFIIQFKPYIFEEQTTLSSNQNHKDDIYFIPAIISKKVIDQFNDPDKKNILLIEDQLEMLTYLQEELVIDYNIFVATNGKEAFDKLHCIPELNLIISDIMMDVMDGFEFLKIITSDTHYQNIPFIFLTAKTSIEEKIKGLQKGAIDYISKPFYIEELKAKIKTILTLQKNEKIKNRKELQGIIDQLSAELHSGLNLHKHKKSKMEANFEKYNLTTREKEVVSLISDGLEYKEISHRLMISTKTVDNFIQNIYQKTGVHNKVELINQMMK